MKSGYFIPFNGAYRLVWIWAVIIYAFRGMIYFELNAKSNFFLDFLSILVLVIIIILIWPNRYFISDNHIYFTTFLRVSMRDVDLKYVTAVRTTRTGVSFSYAGKRYRFVTFGQSKAILSALEKNQATTTAQTAEV